jgi:hypothetical protein
MSTSTTPLGNQIPKRHRNEEADELRAISPSIATVDGEEEEEDFYNDQQALLSATPSSRRQLEDVNKPVEHPGSRNRTHVSNWSYMKEIIYEVSRSCPLPMGLSKLLMIDRPCRRYCYRCLEHS